MRGFKIIWASGPMIAPGGRPAPSSSLINPVLEQIADLLAGDRALLAASHLILLDHSARVPDPRKWQGRRHSLPSVPAAAMMAGAQSLTALGNKSVTRSRPSWRPSGSAAII